MARDRDAEPDASDPGSSGAVEQQDDVPHHEGDGV